jgi:hypothetical protein
MEQCDAIRLKHLPAHLQEEAAENFSILYKTIASRAKKLASEDIATFAFHNASSALRDLHFERTTEEEALIKFQQAHSVIELAEELLHRIQITIDMSSELDTKQRERTSNNNWKRNTYYFYSATNL